MRDILPIDEHTARLRASSPPMRRRMVLLPDPEPPRMTEMRPPGNPQVRESNSNAPSINHMNAIQRDEIPGVCVFGGDQWAKQDMNL